MDACIHIRMHVKYTYLYAHVQGQRDVHTYVYVCIYIYTYSVRPQLDSLQISCLMDLSVCVRKSFNNTGATCLQMHMLVIVGHQDCDQTFEANVRTAQVPISQSTWAQVWAGVASTLCNRVNCKSSVL